VKSSTLILGWEYEWGWGHQMNQQSCRQYGLLLSSKTAKIPVLRSKPLANCEFVHVKALSQSRMANWQFQIGRAYNTIKAKIIPDLTKDDIRVSIGKNLVNGQIGF
jgi:hypothetical protein